MSLESIGKLLLVLGGAAILAGLLAILLSRTGFAGKLPGDIVIRRENLTIYIPLVSFLLLSIIVTVVFNLLARLFK